MDGEDRFRLFFSPSIVIYWYYVIAEVVRWINKRRTRVPLTGMTNDARCVVKEEEKKLPSMGFEFKLQIHLRCLIRCTWIGALFYLSCTLEYSFIGGRLRGGGGPFRYYYHRRHRHRHVNLACVDQETLSANDTGTWKVKSFYFRK